MVTKRILILAPLALVAILLQSWLWVPSYENQARGNPARLEKFVEGSIGDAHFLNPVLSADSAASAITSLVFDTLLDLDEHLALRGKLAESWELGERAYLVVRPGARLADGTPISAEALRERLAAVLGEELISASVVPAEAGAPERIALELRHVIPDLAERLAPLLGAGYLAEHDPERSGGLPALEHNPVLTFRLRRGVRFHDGHELDADDVRFTYDAFVDPRNISPRASDFEPVKAIEVVDPHTVRVVYERLFSPAVYVWASYGILPEHLLNREALAREMDRRGIDGEARERFGLREAEFTRHPIGTGPFRFERWESDDLIQLVRFDDYFEGPAEYAEYTMRIVPDLVTQELEFRTGALDLYPAQPHQAARFREDPSYRAFSSVQFGYSYIGYNARNELFADPDVRRALGMAIDVGEILEYVLYGEGEPVSGPFAVTTEWYDRSVPPLGYDPEGARALLAEKGWRPGPDGILEKDGKRFAFSLITNNGNPQRKAIATIAQHAWRRLGIECRVQLFEWAVFLKDFINTGRFDAVVLGWSTGIDPDLYQIFHSSQTGPGQLNFTGYVNPEADRLIDAIRLEYERDRQRELAHRLHRVIAADQPYTFLFAARGTQVVDRKIVMVERDAEGNERVVPLRPSPTGRLDYWFTRWKKLDHAPDF